MSANHDSAASPSPPVRPPAPFSPRFGVMYPVMRWIGDVCLPNFYSKIQVNHALDHDEEGLERVRDPDTPIMLLSTHHNTMIDVALLSSHVPSLRKGGKGEQGRRKLHYWAKSGLFKNPISNLILTSSGNIRVDRRRKGDNRSLFQGTFLALSKRQSIALFPEGGSFTRPCLTPLKSGAAWAALEFYCSQSLTEEEEEEEGKGVPSADHPRHPQADDSTSPSFKPRELTILPASIVYTDKSAYRSNVLLQFSKPIPLQPYVQEFLSKDDSQTRREEEDGTTTNETKHRIQRQEGSRRAVERLTREIEEALKSITINAPDWETWKAMVCAREMLWSEEVKEGEASEGKGQLYLGHLVAASQRLIELLTLDKVEEGGESVVPERVRRASSRARKALFLHSTNLKMMRMRTRTLERVAERLVRIRTSSHGVGPGKCGSLAGEVKADVEAPSRNEALRLVTKELARMVPKSPIYLGLCLPHLIPVYLLPTRIAEHFAAREEESMASVKNLTGFFLNLASYLTIAAGIVRWSGGRGGSWWRSKGWVAGLGCVYVLNRLHNKVIDRAIEDWSGLVATIGMARSSLSVGKGRGDDEGEQGSKARSSRLLFFYGSLIHPKVLLRVIGGGGGGGESEEKKVRSMRWRRATLQGHRAVKVKGEDYPACIRNEGEVQGWIVEGLCEEDVRALDFFEGEEYLRVKCKVQCRGKEGWRGWREREEELDRGVVWGEEGEGGEEEGVEMYLWRDEFRERLLVEQDWEFEEFLRSKAKEWVGEGRIKMEDEYESVDRFRSDGNEVEGMVERILHGEGEEKHKLRRLIEDQRQDPPVEFYVKRSLKGRPPSLARSRNGMESLFSSRRLALEELGCLLEVGGEEVVNELRAFGAKSVSVMRKP